MDHDKAQLFEIGKAVFCSVCKQKTLKYIANGAWWQWECVYCGSCCDTETLVTCQSDDIEFFYNQQQNKIGGKG